MRLAKSSIARVSLLFSFSASLLASADEAADISHIRGTLDILNEYVQADQMQFLQGWKQAELQALQNVVPVEYQDRVLKSLVGRGLDDTFQWSDTDNIRAYLKQLTASVYGTPGSTLLPGTLLDNSSKSLTQLYAIRNLLAAVSNSLVSSSSSSGGKDVLAGNPWWTTNSTFRMVVGGGGSITPPDPDGNYSAFPFQHFMSYWSYALTRGMGTASSVSASTLANKGNWLNNYYGATSKRPLGILNGTTYSGTQPYTWFDWVSDAMRSNLVAQATQQHTLDSLLSASLNSGGSTNIVNVFVTNIVGGVTNILCADDILAANPWWATNSGFKIAFHNSLIEPYPIGEDGALSFPEIFSRLAATHTRFQTPPLNDSREWLLDSWGFDRYNTRRGQLFTFEDWIAEMVRSNLVLNTAANATNIEDELFAAGYDTDTSDTITNTPLPDYSLPSSESIPEAENVLQQGESTVNSFIQSLPQPGTGGNPEIVLIPEFSVGGIHVREYRASLSSPIVPTCHAVLSFLYAVGLACFVFKMAKAEYVYYASIGRQWGRYD